MTALLLGPAARHPTLPLREVFGPVPQGEGPYAGRRSVFVRFGNGCNLRCPPCDTKDTWDRSQYDIATLAPQTFVADIVRQAVKLGAGGSTLTVASGGEPLLWQRKLAWDVFLDLVPGPLHIETNGTILPSQASRARVDHFTVSPKIGAMGAADPLKTRIKPDVLAAFNVLAARDKAAYKFVAGGREDVEDIAALVEEHRIPRRSVWVMPLGATRDQVHDTGQVIVDEVMGRGFHISGRLHLELGVR